jgi:phosphate starvation-inducible PhoH-like protein
MAKRPSNARPKIEDDFGPIINKVLSVKHRLKCKNDKQKAFAKLITEKDVVIAYGSSGTGKTYISIARAIELLQNTTTKFDKIVVCKPLIEVGPSMGFLPGPDREKMDPIIASVIDIFDKIIGVNKRVMLEDKGIIVVQPIGFLRGKTLDNAIVIVDEAQNMSPIECKTVLTRLGANSKMIISGDLDQSDKYKDVTKSGLYDIATRHRNIEEFGFIEFGQEEVVRNPLITKILANYGSLEVPKIPENDSDPNIIFEIPSL